MKFSPDSIDRFETSLKTKVKMEIINIVVFGDGPSGMRLDGGGPFPTYVAKLHKRGRARLSGVRIGDELLSINGFPCSKMDLHEAQDIVSYTPDIQLHILRRFWNIYPEEWHMKEIETDSSGLHSPRLSKNITQITSPISFRTTNKTGITTIPIYITEGASFPQTSDISIKQHGCFNSRDTSSPLCNDSRLIKRHVSRAYIIPENNKVSPKEFRLFQSHIDPIKIKSNFKDEIYFDIPKSTFSNSFDICHRHEPKYEGFEPSNDWGLSSKSNTDHKIIPCEEVIIWSSKKLPSPEKEIKIPPLIESKPWKPRPFSSQIKPPSLSVLRIGSSSPIDDSDTSKVVVNEELIGAGLLTRGFVTAGGVPVEMHLETKKLYSDSSFYQDPCHKYPTIEEQIKMARKVANLLTSSTGHIGKGQKMFQKRQEMSSKWVTHLDPLVEANIKEERERKQPIESPGHISEGPFDQLSRANRVSELEKMRLKEEKSLHDIVPFDLCFQLANELQNFKGKGGKLFAKIKSRSEDWVTSENDPKLATRLRPINQGPKSHKELIEFTPLKYPSTPIIQSSDIGLFSNADRTRSQEYNHPPSRLKDMINNPRPVFTPWDSVVETGSVERAFENAHHRHCDDDRSYNPFQQCYGHTFSKIHLNGCYTGPTNISDVSNCDVRTYRTNKDPYIAPHIATFKPVHFRPII